MMLEKIIRQLPESPGIYQYFDENRRLLYIGKAKSLKNRIKSYFKFSPIFTAGSNLSPRIYKMIGETRFLEYIVVDSEHDALILENSLIKQLKPKYNILLRDDKTYPYIYIDLAEPFPRFEITRKVINGKKIRYFGPFSASAREIYNAVYDLFPLVQKKGCLKGKKACLFHQIKKCHAPCEGKITSEDYHKIVEEAIALVHDKSTLVKTLEAKMVEYAENLMFEEAAATRDQIEKIKKSLVLTQVDLARLEDFDIFAVAVEETRACAVRMFIRQGKIISSSHTIFKSDNGFDKEELYERTLLEYYLTDMPPLVKNILLHDTFDGLEIIEEVLSKKFEKKIHITVPQRGEKRKLTLLAEKNAKELLKLQNTKTEDTTLTEIKTLFALEKTPYVIETFDNSHMMGTGIVGAMVKWENGFKKNAYRHYNLSAKDEYAQMKELLQKRCESFYKNSPPDLWIIDGGAALLNLALQIVKQNNVFVDVIAIAKEKRDFKAQRAKGQAKDIIYTVNETFTLPVNDKRLQFVQKMRDEAHRFALSFHKKQKLKADKDINLLKKKGVGEATIRKLLQYFETFENIENASVDELQSVVGKKLAENLKN